MKKYTGVYDQWKAQKSFDFFIQDFRRSRLLFLIQTQVLNNMFKGVVIDNSIVKRLTPEPGVPTPPAGPGKPLEP